MDDLATATIIFCIGILIGQAMNWWKFKKKCYEKTTNTTSDWRTIYLL